MTGSSLSNTFGRNGRPPAPGKKRKLPPPFSIRLTDEERERIERDAGALSIAAYIRMKLFCDEHSGRPARRSRTKKQHSPSAELAMISNMLGALGSSELAASMSRISKAADIGALPVTPELETEIAAACSDIRQMREALISALGVKAR
ncbi:MAG: hypothetical protein AAGB10_22720 [Pseudomonadota bacterium]